MIRDGIGDARYRLAAHDTQPAMSIISLIELEGGVVTRSETAAIRRKTLNLMLRQIRLIDVDPPVAHTYGAIVEAQGFSRRKILDRLIAATAIVHGLTLVTVNGDDFADIPGLSLEVWPAR